jgi:hypothetical protein
VIWARSLLEYPVRFASFQSLILIKFRNPNLWLPVRRLRPKHIHTPKKDWDSHNSDIRKKIIRGKDKKPYLFPKLCCPNPQASPLTPSIPSLPQSQRVSTGYNKKCVQNMCKCSAAAQVYMIQDPVVQLLRCIWYKILLPLFQLKGRRHTSRFIIKWITSIYQYNERGTSQGPIQASTQASTGSR